MATPALPSMRVVYFTSLDSQTANGLLQLFDAFGQQVVLVVVTSGPPARPTVAYKDVVANIVRGLMCWSPAILNGYPGCCGGWSQT